MPSAAVKMRVVNQIATVAISCPPLLQAALEPERAEELAAALKALADPARLRLLSLIQAQPNHEACVCHLTQPLGLKQPTVSHHLRVLLDVGLVTREQRGSWAYYRVEPQALRSLRALLT
jgi:ArsR family transcriptional regulator, arsenate/arsenite/antimonite-responsive transcriptional repressor